MRENQGVDNAGPLRVGTEPSSGLFRSVWILESQRIVRPKDTQSQPAAIPIRFFNEAMPSHCEMDLGLGPNGAACIGTSRT